MDTVINKNDTAANMLSYLPDAILSFIFSYLSPQNLVYLDKNPPSKELRNHIFSAMFQQHSGTLEAFLPQTQAKTFLPLCDHLLEKQAAEAVVATASSSSSSVSVSPRPAI